MQELVFADDMTCRSGKTATIKSKGVPKRTRKHRYGIKCQKATTMAVTRKVKKHSIKIEEEVVPQVKATITCYPLYRNTCLYLKFQVAVGMIF